MKKIYLLFALLCIFSLSEISAQRYQSAVGLRLGSPVGLNGKLFVSETNAIEATIAFRGSVGWSFFDIMGAYMFQHPLEFEDFENLDWFWGAGALVQFWNYRYSGVFAGDRYGGTSFGIQGHIGVEYVFEDIPLNIALAWSPAILFNRSGHYGSIYGWGRGLGYVALTGRYILER